MRLDLAAVSWQKAAMSIRIEHRIGIAASPEAVWNVIADLGGWGAWNALHPEATGRIAFGGQLEVAEVLDGEPGRLHQVTIPDWTPEIQLVWVNRRGFLSRSTRYFELEPLSGGGTLLANGELFDGLRGEAWAKARRGKFLAAFEAINDAIKARAEAA